MKDVPAKYTGFGYRTVELTGLSNAKSFSFTSLFVSSSFIKTLQDERSAGISSIIFDTGPVTEPATNALLGLGLAGLTGAKVKCQWGKSSRQKISSNLPILSHTYTCLLHTPRDVGFIMSFTQTPFLYQA